MSTAQLPSYLTIGGALVTLTLEDGDFVLDCGGCGLTNSTAYDDTAASNLAQSHSEECRAIPRLPEGVIARAKTAGGGHIDIRNGQPDPDGRATANGHCTGCRAFKTLTGHHPNIAVNRIMDWAHKHSSCPFIPGGAA